MDEKEHKTHPKGHFPLLVQVWDKGTKGLALQLLQEFVAQAANEYMLSVLRAPEGDGAFAETVCSVPFPDRERIRISFNIFASEKEDEFGDNFVFHMESAFEHEVGK